MSLAWFRSPEHPDGGETSLCFNCIDVHARGPRCRQAALITTGPPGVCTYLSLLRNVSAAANVLWDLGARAGDEVLLRLGTRPERVISMLACARIGAVHVDESETPRVMITDRPEDIARRHEPVLRVGRQTRWRHRRDPSWEELLRVARPECPAEPVTAGAPVCRIGGRTIRTVPFLEEMRKMADSILDLRDGDLVWNIPSHESADLVALHATLLRGCTLLIAFAGDEPGAAIEEHRVNILMTPADEMPRIRGSAGPFNLASLRRVVVIGDTTEAIPGVEVVRVREVSAGGEKSPAP